MRKIDKKMVAKKTAGKFVCFKGETFYRIENFDAMTDFFMTITSASDIWNFLWSKGGISAGRRNSEYALFPYYTADKISDMKYCTGSFTSLKIYTQNDVYIWIPFSELQDWDVQRNLYKNRTGSKIWFEEINKELQVVFRYGWTSSSVYGLVRTAELENISKNTQDLCILDGCRNIMPACVTSALQKDNSFLVDAYKKTDLDMKTGLTMFGMSSILTDKAEPSEALRANTCWFSIDGPVFLDEKTPLSFMYSAGIPDCPSADDINITEQTAVLKGKRSSCYISKKLHLEPDANRLWYQVFDTALDLPHINNLRAALVDRQSLTRNLEADIDRGQKLIESYIREADGFQDTGDLMSCVHHETNVMFNIMRGGIIADNGQIQKTDFMDFVQVRSRVLYKKLAESSNLLFENKDWAPYAELGNRIRKIDDNQISRIYLEYLPLTFSRRHGDPSRPWNNFSIETQNPDGSKTLNYEGNWRDIFQNWEALAVSYPEFTGGMIARFLNALTPDGFNPYHISRSGIEWELPDPGNPWSNIGYWNDHQIIYLCKLLELQYSVDPNILTSSLDRPLYSSSNVPYRIKKFDDILDNPRSTIEFDYKLNDLITSKVKKYGTDEKLLCASNHTPVLVSMTTKLLQILIAKMANFVPGGGIWMNTQRPEWNDANNALAGYGLSMVTVYYLRRYISFLMKLFNSIDRESFSIPTEIAGFFTALSEVFEHSNPKESSTPQGRAIFVATCGKLFEAERDILYSSACYAVYTTVSRETILEGFAAFQHHIDASIEDNKRQDGLYHSYNILETKKITEKEGVSRYEMTVKHLDIMLEGQVAILSSGIIKPQEAADLYDVLKESSLRERRQYSYLLYPNKTLPFFASKNCVSRKDAESIPLLKEMLSSGNTSIITADTTTPDFVHFTPDFRNADVLRQTLQSIIETGRKDSEGTGEKTVELCKKDFNAVCCLYENTFHHKSFTGRSGTFYAFEGIGSIYWHMVSKLLLAVQENIYQADSENKKRLIKAYYDIRAGLGFNKSPDVYGAFPSDPYSHTPSGQGAKQPGMTGQVKEEIITRWGELGIFIKDGEVVFYPVILRRSEFKIDGTLQFSRFGCKFIYRTENTFSNGTSFQVMSISVNGKSFRTGSHLTKAESRELFTRSGKVSLVQIIIPNNQLLNL